ncbi:MAG: ferritin-like domain-containing protein [Planctomycetota bacterium]|nr:ferritin-like domain-containing protein [Planctomycetota bacterium]MEC8253479.1 ferritin-like domain-containing protein [Planctomycetota bacterium]MEC9046655.1 ferritin-like domain-containing protein [Planctomycetota bacterium]
MSTEREKVIAVLNEILEIELAGVVRYTHYSLMVFGHARIPITKWFRDAAAESQQHAIDAGEYLTSLGGHPSLKIGPLLETHQHNIDAILEESLEHEKIAVNKYRELQALVEGKDVRLEEYSRTMVMDEENHLCEIEKMLRRPGETTPVAMPGI